MQWLRRLSLLFGSVLLLLVVVPFLFLAWLSFTNAGANWAVQQALPYSPVAITYTALEGSLWAGLEVRQLSVQAQDDALGFESITASELNFTWQPLALISGRIQVGSLVIKQADVRVLAQPDVSAEPVQLPQFNLPLNVEVRSLKARAIRIISDNKIDLVPDLDARVWMGGDQLVVSKLSVTYEQVDYEISGRVKFSEALIFKLKVPTQGVNLSGSCKAEPELRCNAELAWRNFSHPITADMQSPNGQMSAVLSGSRLVLKGEADFIWPYEYAPIDTHGVVDAEINFEQEKLAIHSLAATFAGGDAQISGELSWVKNFSLDLNVAGQDVSLAYWLPQELAESKVSLQAGVKLSVVDGDVNLQVHVPSTSLNFGAKPVHGSLDFELTPKAISVSNVALAGAGSYISGMAMLGFDDSFLIAAKVKSESLQSLVPELSGKANLTVDAKGSLLAPNAALAFEADGLALSDWQVEHVNFKTHLVVKPSTATSTDTNLQKIRRALTSLQINSFDADLKNLSIAQTSIGSVVLSLVGTVEQHSLNVSGTDLVSRFQVPTLSVDGKLVLANGDDFGAILKTSSWQASLQALEFDDGLHNNFWRLKEPSSGLLSINRLQWQPLCMQQASVSLCLDKLAFNDWTHLDFAGSMRGFYLDRERSLYPSWYATLPEEWKMKGELLADWAVDVKLASGRMSNMALNVQLQSRQVEMIYTQSDEPSLSLPVENFQMHLTGDENDLRLEGELLFDENQQLKISGGAQQWQTPKRSMQMNVNGGIGRFAYLQPFFPAQRDLVGTATANISIALPQGANQFEYQGKIAISNAGLLVPETGTALSDWQILLEAERGDLVLNANGKVGDGLASIDGKVLAEKIDDEKLFQAQLGITGTNLHLVNLPDVQLVANPNLTIAGDGRRWHLSGDIRVHDSSMILRELPVSAAGVSEDARIYGGDESKADESLMELTSDVVLGFDKRVKFDGFGLNTDVEGELRYTRDQLRLNQAHGVVLLKNGRFRSYGQKLDIDDGRIIFSGPIDNPALSVLALRRVDDDIVVGIRLTGNAKRPKSELYSETSMSEADILSYMVSGKPISQSGAGEVVDMQSAALSLGLKQALPLLQRVGGEFGISDISVEENSNGGSSIAAGKRLSEKLYVKYVYGLLGAAGDFVVQYKLSDQLSIETSSGVTQAIDMTYRWDSKPPSVKNNKESDSAIKSK